MITAQQARSITEGEFIVVRDRDDLTDAICCLARSGDYGAYLAINATRLQQLRSHGFWVNGAIEPVDDSRAERMFVDWSGRFEANQ